VLVSLLFSDDTLLKSKEIVGNKIISFIQSLNKEEQEEFPFYLKKYISLMNNSFCENLSNMKKLSLDNEKKYAILCSTCTRKKF
jgi:hypothetical protein